MGSSSRFHRNIKERDRRMHMKDLTENLASLMPSQSSRLSVPKLLDHATMYVKHLKRRVKEMNRRKEILTREQTSNGNQVAGGSRLPTINIRTIDSTLEVNLISGLNKNFMLHEIISILNEEGADVISVAHYNAGDRVIYIIKSQKTVMLKHLQSLQDVIPRIGVETSRLHEKLKELVL